MEKFTNPITTSSLKYLRGLRHLAREDSKLQNDLFLLNIVKVVREGAGWYSVPDKDRKRLDNLMRRIMNSNPNIDNPIIVPNSYYKNVSFMQTYYTGQRLYDNPLTITVEDLLNIPIEPEIIFPSYGGEVGIIYADEPKNITQQYWEENILLEELGNNFTKIVGDFPNSMELAAIKGKYKGWIALVPETTTDVNLEEYRGQQGEELNSTWEDYEYVGTIFTGNIVLDQISYVFSAIRPNTPTRIKYTK